MRIVSIKNFINKHFTFQIQFVTGISIIVALLIYPSLSLPEQFGYENGLFENIQLIILLLGFIISIRAKNNKKFFNFVAMVIIILFLREINCGRTIFFPIPGEINSFYRWQDLKYGYLAHPIYGLYMAFTAIYFFKNKLYLPLTNFIIRTKLPIFDIIIMFIGMFIGLAAEKHIGNIILEETGELLFYTALVGIIYLYSSCTKH